MYQGLGLGAFRFFGLCFSGSSDLGTASSRFVNSTMRSNGVWSDGGSGGIIFSRGLSGAFADRDLGVSRSRQTCYADEVLGGEALSHDATQRINESGEVFRLAVIEAEHLLVQIPEQVEGSTET